MLANDQTAVWYNFDKQWNAISFPVKDMSAKLVRLENMGLSLPLWERNAVAGGKRLISEIAGESHELKTELNSYYTGVSNPSNSALTGDSSVLARDAGRLVRTMARPEAAQASNASLARTTKHS